MALLGSATCFGQFSSHREFGTPKLPPHVKLVPDLKPAPKRLQNVPPSPAVTERPTANVQQAPAKCGHIIVFGFRAAQNVDPKFTVPIPPDPNRKMPVHQGLPPCPEDIL